MAVANQNLLIQFTDTGGTVPLKFKALINGYDKFVRGCACI